LPWVLACYVLAMGILIAMGWLWISLLWAGYGYCNCALLWVFFTMSLYKYNTSKKICPLMWLDSGSSFFLFGERLYLWLISGCYELHISSKDYFWIYSIPSR
jgi:hypothetical protein